MVISAIRVKQVVQIVIKIIAGSNQYGALGLPYTFNVSTSSNTFLWYLKAFRPLNLNATNISRVSIGTAVSGSSYIVMDDGSLLVAGNNSYGQLGVGHNNNVSSWTTIPGPWSYVEGGNSYAIGLSGNNLYSTGRNDLGQLGTKNNTNYNSWQKVGNNIFKISASSFSKTTLVSDVFGGVSATGDNSYGQLGLGNNTNINYLSSVNTISQIPIIFNKIIAGESSFINDIEGNWYACGKNNLGQYFWHKVIPTR